MKELPNFLLSFSGVVPFPESTGHQKEIKAASILHLNETNEDVYLI
jgi:hypothetical protein